MSQIPTIRMKDIASQTALLITKYPRYLFYEGIGYKTVAQQGLIILVASLSAGQEGQFDPQYYQAER